MKIFLKLNLQKIIENTLNPEWHHTDPDRPHKVLVNPRWVFDYKFDF